MIPISNSLATLFKPRSVAIVGASDDPATMGSRPMRYLAQAGYDGDVFLINPRKAAVPGFTAALTDLEIGSVDLAVVLVRADRVLATLEDCADLQVGSVIIGSAGFAEAGEDGAALEAQIVEFAKRTGIRVLGPNCLGLVQGASKTYATFASLKEGAVLGQPGSGLAIVSQSGALASYAVDLLERNGTACRDWISTGNEVDVDAADCLNYYAAEPEVNGILLYVEGTKDVEKLRRSLETAASAGKVVAVVKAGRTAAGAEAVASHTASIAGEDVLFDALLRQCGALRLRDFSEVITFAELMSGTRIPTGPRIGILSLSGGVGALMVDECVDANLELPPIDDDVKAKLKQLVPFASIGNPMDPTGAVAGDPGLLSHFLDALADIPDLDSLVLFPGPALVEERYGRPIVEAVVALTERSDVFVLVSGAPVEYARTALRDAGVALCSDPLSAVRIVAAIQSARTQRLVTATTPTPVRASVKGAAGELSALVESAASDGIVSERAAKQIIEHYGVRVPAQFATVTADEAEAVFSTRPGTYVMKAAAPGVAHKTEAGLVKVDISSASDARRAFDAVASSLAALGLATESVFLEEQVSGTEVLVSVRLDPAFGSVLTVGSGGFYAEVERDVTVWLGLPSMSDFRTGLESLRAWGRMSGYRGRPLADIDALYQLCCAAMAVLHDPSMGIVELELNPVAVRPQGEGAVALDAVGWLDSIKKGTLVDG